MELVNACYSCISFFLLILSCKLLHEMCSLELKEKSVTQVELVEKPSYDLAKTIHNKWLQTSGNKEGDMYVAAINDYI